jgi:AcrR family transcriptional regulator
MMIAKAPDQQKQVDNQLASQHTVILSELIAQRHKKRRKVRTLSANEKLVDGRRTKIIKRALRLFRQKGIKGVTMADVAKTSRMSIGSLYRYFGGKDDLLYAIRRGYENKLNEFFITKLTEIEDLKPSDALRELIKSYIYSVDASRNQVLILYLDTRSMPKADQEAVKQGDEYIIKLFEHILIKGIHSGEFKIDNIKLIAHNIKALADLWAIRGWTLKDSQTLEGYIKGQTEFILKAIIVNKE